MKNYFLRIFLYIFLFFVPICLFSQELQWKAGLYYFFDNTEFARSTIAKPQTMAGVHLSPEIGISWNTEHSVYAGVDMLKLSGSQNVTDKTDLIAYYQNTTPLMKFRAGAFQRAELLSNYSDFFFQDSVINFRPIIHGLFWQVGQKHQFFNFWLDWVSHQTVNDREIFYVGASAHKRFKYFFTDFQSYLYHFAGRENNLNDHVCDNALAHLSVGVDYSNRQGLDTLLFAIGALTGFERERALVTSHTPLGAVVRFNVEYRGIGINNMMYVGNPRLVMYKKFGGNLYWSNPFLQSNFYLESRFYLNLFHSSDIQGKIASNFHISERKLMYEQTFYLRISLNNHSKFDKKTLSIF